MKQESLQEQVKRARENRKRNLSDFELQRKLNQERVEAIRKIEEAQDKAAEVFRGKKARA